MTEATNGQETTAPQVNSTKFKVDLPFDMNNLFNMSYSFDQLRIAIEYLAQQ